jgi:GAF domain-containing protein
MDTEKLAETFVRLADTLVDDYDVHDVLHTLTLRCAELLDAAAVGLMLTDAQGELQLTVASSETARLLEVFQNQRDEGPCLDCYHTGEPVHTQRLGKDDARWPRFAPMALEAGFTSVMALPMRLRGQVIGALNLFGDANGTPIGADQVPIAQALADVATIAILQDRLARDRTVLTEQLQTALNSRVSIEQAKGAVAHQFDVDTNTAFEMLREYARSHSQRLVEVAQQVVDAGGTGAKWLTPGQATTGTTDEFR